MSETSQQSTPRMNVESFNLDHTKVAAPYVRVADRKELPGGDVLVKYDVRFCQPNREHLEMEAVHSIEHLSAELMRNHTDRLIDFSPMGCQTGFYALMLGVETEEFLPLLEATFRDILTAQEVPAANEVQCGWGANHSLAAAQEAVRDFLAARDEWTQVMALRSRLALSRPAGDTPPQPGTSCAPGDTPSQPGTSCACGDGIAVPDGVECPWLERDAPGRAECPRRRDEKPPQPGATETTDHRDQESSSGQSSQSGNTGPGTVMGETTAVAGLRRRARSGTGTGTNRILNRTQPTPAHPVPAPRGTETKRT